MLNNHGDNGQNNRDLMAGTVNVAAEAEFCVSSRQLLGAGNTVRIEHNGELYCLRLTRNNKLILTK